MSEFIVARHTEKRKNTDDISLEDQPTKRKHIQEDNFVTDIKELMPDAQYVNPNSESKQRIINFETRDICDIIKYFISNKTSNKAFYIVDLSEVVRLFEVWKRELPRVKPYYAIKSNSDPMIAKVLAKLGCSFDCASDEEIMQVLKLGVDSKNIIYANPVKDPDFISLARGENVDLLTFDSKTELKKIDMLHPNSKLILRIKVDDSGSVCRFNSKFGCFDEEIETLLDFAKDNELDICGVSFHLGSNLQNYGFFDKAIKKAREVFETARTYGFNFSVLDLGGGFSQASPNVNFVGIAQEINESLDKYFGDLLNDEYDYNPQDSYYLNIFKSGKQKTNEKGYNFVNVLAEPGRYFCATTHTLVTSIIGIKSRSINGTKEFTYTINESLYQSFNCKVFDHAHPEIFPYNERNEETRYMSGLVGESCDSLDRIADEIMLPELSIGDFVYVPNFGAYTRVSSSTFNGFKLANVHYITTS